MTVNSTVLCNDIFVVCCAVLFGFGFHCIVLFCLCMLSVKLLGYAIKETHNY